MPAMRAGASLDIDDRPTGEMQSSEVVWKKYSAIRYSALTRIGSTAVSTASAAKGILPIVASTPEMFVTAPSVGRTTMNANAVKIMPMPNLLTLDGSFLRRASASQIHANTGASARM